MPRVPFQTLTTVRQNEAPIQSGAFQQTAQAASNLMSAIGGAAQTVQGMFDQAQDLKNRSDIMEKRRIIRTAQGEFLNEMAGLQKDGTMGRPVPPEQWGQLWQERLKTLQKKVVEDKDAPPVVRRNISEVFKDFSGTSFIQIAGAALKESRRNARQNFDRDLQFFVGEGRTEEAVQLVEENRGTVLTEDEASDTLRSVSKVARDNSIRNNMILDPFATAEDIKNGKYKLSETKKAEWLEKIDSYQRTSERKALQFANQSIEAGEIEDEEGLEDFFNSKPEVSKTARKAFIKNFSNTKPLSEVERTSLRDRYDELVLFTGDPKEYEKKFDALSRDYEMVKRRAGRPYLDLPNRNPQYYEKRFREGASAAQKDRFKTLLANGRSLVKPMVESTVKAEFADAYKKGDTSSLKPGDKKFNAKLKGEEETKIAFLRGVVDRAIEDYISGLPPDAKVGEPELRAWLDENIDKIMDQALDKYEEEKTNLESAKAQKVRAENIAKSENELQDALGGAPPKSTRKPRLKVERPELEGPGILPPLGIGGGGGQPVSPFK